MTHGDRFSTTHWSVVLAAGGDSSSDAREALATLCAAYWYPLYAFLRRRGHPVQDAEDLTQGFLGVLLERGAIKAADPNRGRFRSFLLTSLRHYVTNEHQRAAATKRGRHLVRQGLDVDAAERRYAREPPDRETPERTYERRWALTLLDRVLVQCKQDYERSGKGEIFLHLRPLLTDATTDRPYADIARDLGMSEGAVKVAAHRLRQHYRRVLRNEVAQTVSSPDAVDSELRHLLQAVSGSR